MALVFLGKVGVERYVVNEKQSDGTLKGVTKSRPDQQFKAGVMIVQELVKCKVTKGFEQAKGKDGQAILDEKGNPIVRAVEVDGVRVDRHTFSPSDIGKPYDCFQDEKEVLKRYPAMFKKA